MYKKHFFQVIYADLHSGASAMLTYFKGELDPVLKNCLCSHHICPGFLTDRYLMFFERLKW